jgi:Zn-dependent protease
LDSETLKGILLLAPVLLFSFTAHEFAHAWAALSQGDPTARDAGRLTLNPLKHIDPWWTIILPGIMLIASHGQSAFGGAKPCPVDPSRYRHPKWSDIIVSLAGVTMNLIIAIVSALIVIAIGVFGQRMQIGSPVLETVQRLFAAAASINVLLIIFNLLPIPPLDGSHVVRHFLPPAFAADYDRAGRYGILILIVLFNVVGGPFVNWVFVPSYLVSDSLARFFIGAS